MSNIKDKIEEVKKLFSKDLGDLDSVNEFFEVLAKGSKPCKDGEDDCPDLVSPCCNAVLKTCMGTLPLKATCKECGKEYNLRELLYASDPIKKDN